jgi:hypothetical protein
MSGDANRSSTASEPRPSPAAEVSFTGLSNGERNGESSSQAESRASAEKWSERGERLKEKFLTPDRAGWRVDGEDRGGGGSETRRKVRNSGGFLRESVLGHATPRSSDESSRKQEGKRKAGEGGLQVEKRPSAANRFSLDSSHGSSPLSREVSGGHSAYDGTEEQSDRPRPTTMDPAQLVQMALSLSESRKRQASGSLPVPLPTPRGRNISGTSDGYGTVRSRGSGRPRMSLPFNTPSPRQASRRDDRSPAEAADVVDDNVLYTFSPASLARAEKARKYFELAHEHRRLLQNLPPLKPDANASGNYLYRTTSSPGYAQPEFQRVRSNTTTRHELGRQYNPLQTLRNRKLRYRERRALPVPTEQFQDTVKVMSWMDDVENAAQRPGYRTGEDVVHLPRYGEEIHAAEGMNGGFTKGHKRSGTAGSVITRPENDWTIEPAEHLADAYWTEQGDNKMLIENRRNRRIFSPRTNANVDIPRKSAELSRSGAKTDDTLEEEPEDDIAPRKHRHLLSLHKPDRVRRHKLSRANRSASVSSASSTEGRKYNPFSDNGDHEFQNIGPLQRHMNEMIAKDENGEFNSPDLVSPDHWDSKGTPFPVQRHRAGSGRRESRPYVNGNLSVDLSQEHRRSKSADGRVSRLLEGEQVRSSFESTPPMTPAEGSFMPSMAIDLSPPYGQRSTGPKHKSRILPIFRSKSKERNTTEGRDFAFPADSDRSRESSGNVIDPTRLSIDSARPMPFRRHQTSDNGTSSLHRYGTNRTNTTTDGSIKEPSSAVGRFFKGGRIGDLVRNESSRFGRSRKREKDGFTSDVSAMQSDPSDTEGSADEAAPGLTSANDSEASPRTSIDRTRTKNKSYIPNLPTFRSTAGRDKPTAPLLTPVISNDADDDPISRQAAAQRQTSRTHRFAKMAPPRINISGTEDEYTTDMPTQQSEADSRRKSYGFLAANGSQASARSSRVTLGDPGTIGGDRGKLPMTGLSKLQSEGNNKKRHWSISDRVMREQLCNIDARVSTRDLARARALIIASGVKAQALLERANSPSQTPPTFLVQAADTASLAVPAVALKDTHTSAASILSAHLSKDLSALSAAQRSYQSSTAPALHARLDDLKSLAADKLTHLVHNGSDEADAFNVRLNTEQTLRIRQVDDAVDEMLRLRRRQWRLVRGTGFLLLEWFFIGAMWGIWFVVACVNVVRKFFAAVLAVVRWFFSW